MTVLDGDLNAVLVAAVNAKVEASIMEALSGDQAIGRLVTAALQQEVVVKTGAYGRDERMPYVTSVIRATIQKIVKESTGKILDEERPLIETAIRESIRQRVGLMAESLTDNLIEKSKNSYGVNVELKYRDS